MVEGRKEGKDKGGMVAAVYRVSDTEASRQMDPGFMAHSQIHHLTLSLLISTMQKQPQPTAAPAAVREARLPGEREAL